MIVTVGQGVDFLNDEDRLIEHNVFSNSPAKRFDLGLYGPGQSKRVVFDKPGPVHLFCSIHRHMDGAVYVAPDALHGRVDDKRAIQHRERSAGEWMVKTWRRRRFLEKSIPVELEVNKPPWWICRLRRRNESVRTCPGSDVDGGIVLVGCQDQPRRLPVCRRQRFGLSPGRRRALRSV